MLPKFVEEFTDSPDQGFTLLRWMDLQRQVDHDPREYFCFLAALYRYESRNVSNHHPGTVPGQGQIDMTKRGDLGSSMRFGYSSRVV